MHETHHHKTTIFLIQLYTYPSTYRNTAGLYYYSGKDITENVSLPLLLGLYDTNLPSPALNLSII